MKTVISLSFLLFAGGTQAAPLIDRECRMVLVNNETGQSSFAVMSPVGISLDGKVGSYSGQLTFAEEGAYASISTSELGRFQIFSAGPIVIRDKKFIKLIDLNDTKGIRVLIECVKN